MHLVCFFRYAGSIYVGNEVLVDTNDQLIPVKVVNVSILFMQGKTIHPYYIWVPFSIPITGIKVQFTSFSLFKKCIYHCLVGAHVPLTREGNIIVDEVLASCYPSSLDHHLVHLSMGPMRWFPDIMQMIFGEDDGISAFVKMNKYLGTWILPYGQLW